MYERMETRGGRLASARHRRYEVIDHDAGTLAENLTVGQQNSQAKADGVGCGPEGPPHLFGQ